MTALGTACRLWNLGLSVIPLKERDKRPAGRWKQYQTRAADLSELEAWFGEGSMANLAVVTGEVSGLVVVDADNPEAVAAIEARGMPHTPCVQTPNGRHWWLAWPGVAIGNSVRVLDGIDIRGDGGYVAAPPSVHPDGDSYCWIVAPWDIEPAPCPDWLLTILRERQVGSATVATPWDDHLQAEEAWHGGAPGLDDLSLKARLLVAQGDRRGEYARRGSNRTHRVGSAIISECARQGVGVPATIGLLASITPSPKEVSDGKGWYSIEATRKGVAVADREVARKYDIALNFENINPLRDSRNRLRPFRDVLTGWPWRLGDASRLKVLAAVYAIAWRSGNHELAVSTRQAAELASIDQKSAGRALAALANQGFLSHLGAGPSGISRYAIDAGLLSSTDYLATHRLNEALLHGLLHPAFWGGGKLNSLVWLTLDSTPQSVGALAKRLRSDRRTVTTHLGRLAASGLASEASGDWIALGDGSVLTVVARSNGGFDYSDRQRRRHRGERDAQRAGLTQSHLATRAVG